MSLVHLKNKKNDVTYVYESVRHFQQSRHRRSYSEQVRSKSSVENRTTGACADDGMRPQVLTYLFDAIGAKLGITADLKQCFPEIHEQIHSITYFVILEDRNPLSRFSRWARNHYHPYGNNTPSQRSSELFGMINENAKQNFFVPRLGAGWKPSSWHTTPPRYLPIRNY